MRGDVKVKIEGKEHVLRLTLGAMEEVSEVEMAPAVILGALESGVYNAKELGAILRAGLRATGTEISADDLVSAIGGLEARNVAIRLLAAFFGVNASGNADAAEKPKAKASASRSRPTSRQGA